MNMFVLLRLRGPWSLYGQIVFSQYNIDLICYARFFGVWLPINLLLSTNINPTNDYNSVNEYRNLVQSPFSMMVIWNKKKEVFQIFYNMSAKWICIALLKQRLYSKWIAPLHWCIKVLVPYAKPLNYSWYISWRWPLKIWSYFRSNPDESTCWYL